MIRGQARQIAGSNTARRDQYSKADDDACSFHWTLHLITRLPSTSQLKQKIPARDQAYSDGLVPSHTKLSLTILSDRSGCIFLVSGASEKPASALHLSTHEVNIRHPRSYETRIGQFFCLCAASSPAYLPRFIAGQTVPVDTII